MGIPTTEGSITRTSSRSVGSEAVISDAEQMAIAAQRMNLGALDAPTSGAFSDVGGGFFKPGAASGSAVAFPAQTATAVPAQLPALEDLQRASLQTQRASTGRKRVLGAKPSDTLETADAVPDARIYHQVSK